MKIMRITRGKNDISSYYTKLEKCEQINNVDVVIINGERYNYINMTPEERIDTEHYISYDFKDICFHTMGIGSRTNFDDYLLMEEKILNRISPYEEILLIDDSWNQDALKFMIYLKEKTIFILHLITNSFAEFDSDDYHEILYGYRKAFANKYNIAYNSMPCGECKCNGYCNSVCEECDRKSTWLWAEKYEFPYYENNDSPYEYDEDILANINGIDRLRINTDGNGIRSLILMAGCSLDCKYCANKKYKEIFPENEQIDLDITGGILEKDGIYFEMTNGGVTFGGGEPLLQADFIHEFHKKYPMWDIVIETCLNVEFANIEKIADDIGFWYIDIKDMNPKIYQKYTGATNDSVVHNLEKMSSIVSIEKISIRVPRIPGYNTKQDITNSVAKLQALGYTDIEIFDYIV